MAFRLSVSFHRSLVRDGALKSIVASGGTWESYKLGNIEANIPRLYGSYRIASIKLSPSDAVDAKAIRRLFPEANVTVLQPPAENVPP